MPIAITTVSILAIAGVIRLSHRILPFKICPICAGVAGTWFWILMGMYSGWLEAEHWRLIAAMAMGGSVVGIAYQIEKRLPSTRSPILWKMLFIPTGFVAAYSLVSFWWVGFAAASAFLVICALWSIREPHRRVAQGRNAVEELENKMKNCC